MPSSTIYATSDSWIWVQDASYSNVLAGTCSWEEIDSARSSWPLGQLYSTPYDNYEVLAAFDTSSLPDNAIISDVAFSMNVTSAPTIGVAFTLEARGYDYGASATVDDYITSTGLASYDLLASYDIPTGSLSTGYKTFTSSGSTFNNYINLTGDTKFIIVSSRFRNENTPTAGVLEYVNFEGVAHANSTPCKLVITYTTETQFNQSVSGTMGALTGTLSSGHIYTQAIAGVISSMTSVLTRVINKATSGNFSATGATSKFTTKTFAGVSGTLSGSMTYVRVILHQISGTLGTLSGTVSDLQTGFGVNLTGAIESASGSISRSVRKSVSGAFTATGKVFKMNTFRSAIIKAGTVVRKTIQSGRDY